MQAAKAYGLRESFPENSPKNFIAIAYSLATVSLGKQNLVMK